MAWYRIYVEFEGQAELDPVGTEHTVDRIITGLRLAGYDELVSEIDWDELNDDDDSVLIGGVRFVELEIEGPWSYDMGVKEIEDRIEEELVENHALYDVAVYVVDYVEVNRPKPHEIFCGTIWHPDQYVMNFD